MHLPQRSRREAERHSRLAPGLSVFLILIGGTVLAGWTFDLALLKGLGGAITMKANPALALVAFGVALQARVSSRTTVRTAGLLCAAGAGLLGALTLSEHLVGWNLGIDELFFREAPGAVATTSPGRMGPNASLNLTLASIAVLLLYRGQPRAIARAQIIGACITVLALVPVVGYVYGAAQLYAIARYTGIALHTGIALVALGLGILLARPDTGPVAALMTAAPHGVMARQLIVAGIVLPLLLGYARLAGERAGWFDAGLGTAMFVVAMAVLLSVTVWRTAVALGRSDAARQQAQRDRDEVLVREREEAQRADRAKDQFLAALSHELRTPLNAVVGWTHMLRNASMNDGARANAIDVIARNSGALARLVDDLLDTSRIATGHLELAEAPVDVNAVVRAAAESVMPLADAKGVRVTIAHEPSAPIVVGDAQRLQQVFWNLLSNAVKFSPIGGAVHVDIGVATGSVVVRVRDNGEGIDPAFLPHVFEQFKQGAGTTRGTGSLGLGLHIARHLVERHGGRVDAHSDGPGAGATFAVSLPVAESGEPAAVARV